MTRKDISYLRRTPAKPDPDASYRTKFVKPAKTTRRYSSPRIPEEIQEPLRRRLRLAREGLGIRLSQMRGEGLREATTLSKYETNDISTMTVSTLHGVANRFGWSLSELLIYLAGDDQNLTPRSKDVSRITTYALRLSPKAREIACDMLALLVDYDEVHREP